MKKINLYMKKVFSLALAAMFVGVSSVSAFVDVESSHWAKVYIDDLSRRGVINGYPDGRFDPEGALTRAGAVKVVLNALSREIKAVETSGFGDVASDNAFKDYIAAAKEYGVVSGYDDGTFKPDRQVTRAEFVKIFLGAANLVLANLGDEKYFSDVDGSNVFVDYIHSARRLGLLGGYSDGRFGPNDFVTRSQASKIVYNYLISQELSENAEGNSVEEVEMLKFINDSRREAELPELIIDKGVSVIARNHARDLMANDRKTDHYGSDGSDPFDRMKVAGVSYVKLAENIAWGNFHNRSPIDVLASSHNEMMGQSPGEHNHLANIMSTFFPFTHIGIGIEIDDETKQLIVVQMYVQK